MAANATTVSSRPRAKRAVQTKLGLEHRGCLYCLSPEGPFKGNEHIVPRVFGDNTEDLILPPGVVCDPCNNFLGRQVDAPFTDRPDVFLTRAIERLRPREGGAPTELGGRNATAHVAVELGGSRISFLAAAAVETQGGCLDIEYHAEKGEPADVVARSIRALWKIALGAICYHDRAAALDARWDHLRCAVLGAPFRGFLLERPFILARTGHLHVVVSTEHPETPDAVQLQIGGLHVAAPLANGARVDVRQAGAAGWNVRHTADRPAKTMMLRLEPEEPLAA
jgi:hypothetical protein